MTDHLPSQAINIDQLKANMMNNFSQMYQEFIGRIKSIPGSRVLIDRAMAHFDDGFLNFRQAIVDLQITPVPVQQDQLPPTPIEEPVTEIPA